MKTTRTADKKAFSIVEYLALFVIIIGGFIIMQHYIQRGSYGMWAQGGQSFGYGRQFDPQRSIECDYDQASGTWVDRNCMEVACPMSETACVAQAIASGTCAGSYCSTINGAGSTGAGGTGTGTGPPPTPLPTPCAGGCSLGQVCYNSSCCTVDNSCAADFCRNETCINNCGQTTNGTIPNGSPCPGGVCTNGVCETGSGFGGGGGSCTSMCGGACMSGGQACCGGSIYDPGASGCCGGSIYDLSNQACCGGSIYDLSTQGCCAEGAGVIYDLASQCCNGGVVGPC